jgi:type II secretion system protein I
MVNRRRIVPESPDLIRCPAAVARRSGPRGGVTLRTPSGEAQAGFTLLEVLVALTILAFAVVALLQLSSQSLRLVKTSADYQRAVQIADRIATQNQPTEEGTDTGAEGPFQWERRVSLVSLPDEFQPKETVPDKEAVKLFAVSIAVRWGQNQTLELATLYTPTSTPSSGQTTTVGGQPAANPGTATPTTQPPVRR